MPEALAILQSRYSSRSARPYTCPPGLMPTSPTLVSTTTAIWTNMNFLTAHGGREILHITKCWTIVLIALVLAMSLFTQLRLVLLFFRLVPAVFVVCERHDEHINKIFIAGQFTMLTSSWLNVLYRDRLLAIASTETALLATLVWLFVLARPANDELHPPTRSARGCEWPPYRPPRPGPCQPPRCLVLHVQICPAVNCDYFE